MSNSLVDKYLKMILSSRMQYIYIGDLEEGKSIYDVKSIIYTTSAYLSVKDHLSHWTVIVLYEIDEERLQCFSP